MRILHFDCFSGASGDMILGALLDAGVPFEDLRAALGELSGDADAVRAERVTRAGVGAVKLHVRGEHAPDDPVPVAHGEAAAHHDHAHEPTASGGGHRHAHHHPGAETGGHPHASHHPHRTLAEIGRLIDRSSLGPAGKARAKLLFERLGAAESAIHGVPMEQVHLHEVGALDSIVDIVGTVFAMEYLRVARVTASPLNVGGGTIRSAHGVYPVPAPATARLLQGAPVYGGQPQVELVTPTGALLVTGYAEAFGAVPPMRLQAVGYGAGSRDFADRPNVLRVLVGESDDAASSAMVSVIETEIDDMNPQLFGVLMERLLAEGALDVFYTPIQMKKSRPGTLVTVIAAPEAREALTATLFRETTTLGVRYREMARECLERETVSVATELGAVRVKVARRHGEVLNVSPEFDDCLRLAVESGRPVKDVQALASAAFLAR